MTLEGAPETKCLPATSCRGLSCLRQLAHDPVHRRQTAVHGHDAASAPSIPLAREEGLCMSPGPHTVHLRPIHVPNLRHVL